MNDDITRNLDTQSRRLSELDELINATLEDRETIVSSTVSAHHETYDELTASNDELREVRGWTDTNLDRALTDVQRAAWERWQTKHRLSWSTPDLVAVGAVGIIGLLSTWFDASIDSAVRDRLQKLSDAAIVRRWEAAGKRLPIDYMGPGFGGRAHRVKSAGHDLARPIEAIRQVMAGEFRGVRWQDGMKVSIVASGSFRSDLTFTEAALYLAQHLLADVVTPMSLPIPGMSLLHDLGNEALRDFAVHAYSGLGKNTGWNVRSGILTPSISVTITEVLIRTYVHAEAYRTTGSAELDWPHQRRRTELLLAAHGLVSAVSVGKTAAQVTAHALAGNYLRAAHPAHIRHANLPAMFRTGTLAATAISDAYRASRIPSARSWDELIIATAQPWQLDLVDRVEATSREVMEELSLLS